MLIEGEKRSMALSLQSRDPESLKATTWGFFYLRSLRQGKPRSDKAHRDNLRMPECAEALRKSLSDMLAAVFAYIENSLHTLLGLFLLQEMTRRRYCPMR